MAREVSFALVARDAASAAFAKVSRAASRTNKDLESFKAKNGRIDVKLKGNISDLETKLAKARRRLETVPDVTKAKVKADISDLEYKVTKAKEELDDFGKGTRPMSRLKAMMVDLTKSAGAMSGKFFMVTGAIGAAASAASAIVSILGHLNVIASVGASGLGTLAAGGVAAGLAIGTAKIAFAGFGDVLKNSGDPKKYAESLKALDPAARGTATALAKIKGQVGTGVAGRFFKGMGDDVSGLGRTYVPMLNTQLNKTASAFNATGRETIKFLRSGEQVGKVRTLLANSGAAGRTLLGAIRPLAGGLLNFTTAGSRMLPGVAKGIKGLAEDFERFSEKATKGGKNSDFANFIGKIKTALGGLKSPEALAFFDSVKSAAKSVNEQLPNVLQAFKDLAPAIGALVSGSSGAFGVQLKLYADAAIALAPAINLIAQVIGPLGPAIGAVAVATKAASIAMLAFDAAADGNPFGLIALAVVGVAVALTQAWKHSLTFRTVVTEAFKITADVILTIADKILGVYQGVFSALGHMPGKLGAPFRAAASAIGTVRDKLQGVKADIDKMPKVVKIQGKIDDLTSKIEDGKRRLKTLPKSKQAALKADISSWTRDLHTAQGQMNAIHGKTVTVTARYIFKNPSGGGVPSSIAAPGRAVGGPVAAGQPYMVGEKGPELVVPSKSGTVLTAAHTAKLMASSNGHGRDISRGMAAGMFADEGQVKAAGHSLTSAVTSTITGDLQIASPSKVTKAFGKWVAHGLAQGMTGSLDQVKAAAKKLTDVTSKALDQRLKKQLDKLKANAAKRAALEKKIDAAAQKLKDKISQRSDYASGVRSGIIESGSVVKTNGDGENTSTNIIAQMKKDVAAAKAFGSNLLKLKKMGLTGTAYKQIVDAGVDGGAATAAALVAGGAGAIGQVNSLDKQLRDTGTSIGNSTADKLYSAGVNAARGLVKGLQSQEKALERASKKMAAALVKAVKKALGIKSPSKVMETQVGRHIPAGIVRALDRAQPGLDARMDRLVKVPSIGSFTGSVAAGGRMGTGNVYHLHFSGRPIATKREMAEMFVDAVNSEAHRGTTRKITAKAVA